ncbi:hypothetical protein [Alicyclobacillus tolerans]|nr:hypothetical protein [Alicyclobacillus montanus]
MLFCFLASVLSAGMVSSALFIIKRNQMFMNTFAVETEAHLLTNKILQDIRAGDTRFPTEFEVGKYNFQIRVIKGNSTQIITMVRSPFANTAVGVVYNQNGYVQPLPYSCSWQENC